MQEYLPFIVIGLVTGAVYGLAGMGLVLTYKTSGILNIGYGAVATLDAFLFYFLHSEHGVPWPWAAVISIGIFAPVLGLGLELMARSLEKATDTVKVVATVGLILVVEALAGLWFPIAPPPTFPHVLSQSTINILHVYITWEQIIIFLFSVVAAGILFWFFRFVRLGIVMRGVVDNPDLVSMSGDDPVRVRRWAWIIGTVFCAAAGIMLAASLPLDGVSLTTAVFASFGAAAIGYFSNLPLTFIGGLFVGIAEALLTKYAATVSWVGGLAPSLPFVVLFVVLIVIPKGRLAQRRLAAQVRARRAYQAPLRLRVLAGVVAVGLLSIIPIVQSSYLAVWSTALIDIILFLSLGFLVRRSGQISLCQVAFAAVGASTFAHFAAMHIPWLLALVLTALVAVPIGAVIAIPAVRVSGVFLALATLGFGILAEGVFYTRDFMFGQSPLGLAAPRPNVSIGPWNLSTDTGFYYLLLLIVTLVVVIVAALGSGRLGRLSEAMADSPLALETNGTTLAVLKVIVFCIAAAMASVAGALTGMLYYYAVDSYFSSFTSLTLVVLVVLITVGEPWYALIAAIGYSVIQGYITGNTVSNVLTLLFGVSAVFVAYGTRMGGMPRSVQAFLDRLGGRKPISSRPVEAMAGSAEAMADSPVSAVGSAATGNGADGRIAASAVERGRAGLEVHELSVQFGGVKAVDRVTLKASLGAITGVVGPNGAGKTTLFNVCSGLNHRGSGHIRLHGLDIGHLGPAARARRGLGRTFQRTELFDSLSVRANVAMGREAALPGRNPLTYTVGSRSAYRLVAAATEEALALTGITGIADMQVGLLPIGQRRLAQLARLIAGPFDLLLLDEPSSGLDERETEEFGRILQTVVRQKARGILLVEHDMTLVRDICDYVYVLDFGHLIFEGTPEEMHQSDLVRAAYLGGEAPIAADAAASPPPGAVSHSLPADE